MQTNEEARLEAEAKASRARLDEAYRPSPEEIARTVTARAHKIAGQALLAQEAIRAMRPMAEGALGNDLLLALGSQINAGAFKTLNLALDQMITTFQGGFNCTPDQARMCLMYAILFPERAQPQPPRLATRQERRAAERGKKDRNG